MRRSRQRAPCPRQCMVVVPGMPGTGRETQVPFGAAAAAEPDGHVGGVLSSVDLGVKAVGSPCRFVSSGQQCPQVARWRRAWGGAPTTAHGCLDNSLVSISATGSASHFWVSASLLLCRLLPISPYSKGAGLLQILALRLLAYPLAGELGRK